MQIFISNKSTYRLESALSRLQENGRFIVDRIAADIRMAGYNGCLSRGEGVPIRDLTPGAVAAGSDFAIIPFAIDGTNGIRGFNNNGTGWSPGIASSMNLNSGDSSRPLREVVAGTDVLNVQRASSCGVQLTSSPTSNADLEIDITSPNECGFAVNQVAMVTDCSAADVFQIATTSTSAILKRASGTTLSAVYSQEAQVFGWESNAYYVSTAANGMRTLVRSTWSPNSDNSININDFTEVEAWARCRGYANSLWHR